MRSVFNCLRPNETEREKTRPVVPTFLAFYASTICPMFCGRVAVVYYFKRIALFFCYYYFELYTTRTQYHDVVVARCLRKKKNKKLVRKNKRRKRNYVWNTRRNIVIVCVAFQVQNSRVARVGHSSTSISGGGIGIEALSSVYPCTYIRVFID